LRPNQVIQVRGFADQRLRKPQQPQDASNRRVTLIVQYLKPPAGPPTLVTNGTLPQANDLQGPGAAKETKHGR
jgi:chemotaxis protein MotB